jgi:ABC-2 type transport system ATP-binding protein
MARGVRTRHRMIQLTRLVKQFGRFTAVDRLTLTVPAGTLYGFLGPNGAGKTTTMRMIAGILRPTAGSIEIGGIETWRQPQAIKAMIGYIPDRPFVYDKLTGAEFLRFVAALYGQEGAAVERRMDELLELFELGPWRDEVTGSYSHGMRQKLVIASAFVHRPRLIVVDEPMVGLDPVGARVLKDLFRAFVRRGGTVLMSTHTLEVAELMCDRIAIIARGRIVAEGTMPELRAETASGNESLEDIFLRLTGARPPHALDAVLDA